MTKFHHKIYIASNPSGCLIPLIQVNGSNRPRSPSRDLVSVWPTNMYNEDAISEVTLITTYRSLHKNSPINNENSTASIANAIEEDNKRNFMMERFLEDQWDHKWMEEQHNHMREELPNWQVVHEQHQQAEGQLETESHAYGTIPDRHDAVTGVESDQKEEMVSSLPPRAIPYACSSGYATDSYYTSSSSYGMTLSASHSPVEYIALKIKDLEQDEEVEEEEGSMKESPSSVEEKDEGIGTPSRQQTVADLAGNTASLSLDMPDTGSGEHPPSLSLKNANSLKSKPQPACYGDVTVLLQSPDYQSPQSSCLGTYCTDDEGYLHMQGVHISKESTL